MRKRKRVFRINYRDFAKKAIDAAILSIELFNRPRQQHKIESALITHVQAWELVGKAFLLRQKRSISDRGGKTLTAEKTINKLQSDFNKITPLEVQTIQQLISLRNEATHSVLINIPEEILIHLFHYSLKCFNNFIKSNFRRYFKEINQNFLSISFTKTSTYAYGVNKLLRSKRARLIDNQLLYALEKGLYFAKHNSYLSREKWKEKVKTLFPKQLKKLYVKEYLEKHDNIIFVPVEAPKGYGANIHLQKIRGAPRGFPVHIMRTDPDRDFPYFTSDLAKKLGKSIPFISKATSRLRLKGNRDFHLEVRSSHKGRVQKYNDKTLTYLANYFKKKPDFNPFK